MCFLNLVLICHLLEIYAEKNHFGQWPAREKYSSGDQKKINVCWILNTKYSIVISDWNQNIWKTCDAVIMAKTLKRLLLFNTLVCFKNWYWLSKHLEYFVEIFDSRPIFFRPPAPQRRVRRFRENFERAPQQRWAARSTPTAPSNFFSLQKSALPFGRFGCLFSFYFRIHTNR